MSIRRSFPADRSLSLIHICKRPCKGRGILFYRQQGQEPGICGGKGIDAAPGGVIEKEVEDGRKNIAAA